MAESPGRHARRLPHLPLLSCQLAQLREVEGALDRLLHRVIDQLSEEALARASERFDELVIAHPDLRIADVSAYPRLVKALMACLDPQRGPLDGFEDAVALLSARCVTPQSLRALRARLYSVAGRVALRAPDLLPTAAIAAFSLDDEDQACNAFVHMVVCASAIEAYVQAALCEEASPSVDVSTWLAADPPAALIAAIGEGPAYYFAAIPGVLPFLDQERVLFEPERLAPVQARGAASPCPHAVGLGALVDGAYVTRLSAEIARVRRALRERYPVHTVADVEMLAERALDALVALPHSANPLLQAIFVQSWVRYLYQAN
ncbi:MAG: hypothetical protein JXA09_03090 [Anaerolineae bacterium]|nr:hypothetical protein [Anaerolineae bacterium]